MAGDWDQRSYSSQRSCCCCPCAPPEGSCTGISSGTGRAVLEVALRLWMGSSGTGHRVSWAGAHQRSMSTSLPCSSLTAELQDHKPVPCPHLLLGLHLWWGHGHIGVPATGKQHTHRMGRECIIWDSPCSDLSHYIAHSAVSTITAQRNNWPYERNLAFISDCVHQPWLL